MLARFEAEKRVEAELNGMLMSYESRAERAKSEFARSLLQLMATKESNLCVAADLDRAEDILALADQIGPHICMLKIHVDIISNFSDAFIRALVDLAAKHNFKLFADRKFADIGKTVMKQFSGGIYRLSSWVDLINAHSVPGDGVIAGLKEGRGARTDIGLLLLAEMSSKGNLCTAEYQQSTLAMAERHPDFVMGFICMRQLTANPGMLHMTPGVQFAVKGDALGQQYREPSDAIAGGSDIIIVGSGVTAAENKAAAAREYQQAAWQAYKKRVGLTTHAKRSELGV